MSKNSNVKILSVDNPSQRFGNTDYCIFQAETAKGDIIAVGVSHNALSRKGVDANNIVALDSLAGSTLVILSAPVDIREPKGAQMDGEERVDTVVNGTPINGKVRTLLLCSAADCSLAKSETCISELRETNVAIAAKVVVERDKEKKLDAAKKALERAKLRALGVTSTVGAEKAPAEDEPVF